MQKLWISFFNFSFLQTTHCKFTLTDSFTVRCIILLWFTQIMESTSRVDEWNKSCWFATSFVLLQQTWIACMHTIRPCAVHVGNLFRFSLPRSHRFFLQIIVRLFLFFVQNSTKYVYRVYVENGWSRRKKTEPLRNHTDESVLKILKFASPYCALTRCPLENTRIIGEYILQCFQPV